MRILNAAAAAALLTLSGLSAPARAGTSVDMATLTCQDWTDLSDDEQDQMVAWLRGYLAGRSSATLYDYSGAQAQIDRNALKAACRRDATIGVISAMTKVVR